MALGHEDFQGGEAGGEADKKENEGRKSGEKGRIEINQQAETNKEKAGGEYAARDFAGGLRNHICIKLKRHFIILSHFAAKFSGCVFRPSVTRLVT
jgi:hypothetical protein